MKTLIAFAAVILPAFAAPAAEWKEFKSERGNFSVEFPGEPKTSSRKGPTPADEIEIHSAILLHPGGKSAFSVTYYDIPARADLSNVDATLTLLRDSAIKGLNAKLVSERKIKLGAYSGRDVTAANKVAGLESTIHARFYLVGHRFYELIIGYSKDAPLHPAEVAKFFDSFKMLK
jgi:hypothetical protein